MRRIKLTVAYKGTNYCGFQIQPDKITVEGVLNKELSRLLKEEIKIIGASRTDSGVHAMGNVAVFDTESRIPAEKIAYALNQSLPCDIVIQKSEEVAQDFHPRKCVSEKTYTYTILNTKFPNPMLTDTTYFYHYSLDIEKMKQAAKYLIGEHDFKSFCSIKAEVLTTVRTIYSLDVGAKDSQVIITVRGNGFLYNMIRIIAGTLIEVGNGRRTPESVKASIEALDRSASGPTAPPQGLMLMSIKYE